MYRVLVVDDEKLERDGIRFLLSMEEGEWEIYEAANGKLALNELRKHPVDLMLTDIKMPHMDGLELSKKAREEYPSCAGTHSLAPLALLKENRRKFATDNLEIVPGTAPEAMVELPVPTHAFIGGSSGNMNEIIRLLLDKNPGVRIVINCITLETVTEAMNAIRDFSLTDVDIVQLSAARSKSIGRYHMMMGENPIYIISCSGRGEEI